MIVLDATVIIAALNAADSHHDRTSILLRRTAGPGYVASPVTIAEALVRPAMEDKLAMARFLLDELRVTSYPLGDDAPQRLASLRASTGLRMPECCVLLAAQDVRGSIATFDERLADAAAALGIPLVE